MLWLGGFLALELTTLTPDALCPPLEEARAAVKARVGEVRGSYHADFSLIRGDDGHQVLDLRLRDGAQQVLHRELSLDQGGCQDAAQAIALVLERYFDAVETPPDGQSAAAENPVANRPESPAATSAAVVVKDSTTVESVSAADTVWHLHAGITQDFELGFAPAAGVAFFPGAFRLATRLRLGMMLDLAAFLRSQRQIVQEQEITAFTLQGALTAPLELRVGKWQGAVGPLAQLRFQRATAPSLAHQQPAYRGVPGFGGFAALGWAPAPLWSLAGGVALGRQIRGAASRFVLKGGGTDSSTVLVPEAWFGQAQLTIGRAL
jgi:hypothetical protein